VQLDRNSAPGIYSQEIVPEPRVRLPSGVPCFIGITSLKPASNDGRRAPSHWPLPVCRKPELAQKFNTSEKDPLLFKAVEAFFDNGGEHCHVLPIEEKAPREMVLKAIDSLASCDDIDLLVLPMAGSLDLEDAIGIQRHMIQHCADLGDRFAILDALKIPADIPPQKRLREQLGRLRSGMTDLGHAAIYYPWLAVRDSEGKTLFVPPSGAVAGVFARTDAQVGVHKAPANQALEGFLDVQVPIDREAQGELNFAGVNCIRAFPGRGIRIWGARTLSDEPSWRYVNVSRLMIILRRWLMINMGWVSFEPNGPSLWQRIVRELNAHLTGLWRAGALAGETSDAAFYVKCDEELNPASIRELGRVVTEIGLRPHPPAEFIVVRLTQREGVADLMLR